MRVRLAFSREHAVGPQFAHVVPQLGQRVRRGSEPEGFQHGAGHLEVRQPAS